MAISPFAFDPPTGWNDATVFPTYETSEAKVRSDLQKLHNQTRDYINSLVTSLNRNMLLVEIPSLNELPRTVINSKITDKHVVLHMTLGTPAAQTGEWTVETENGSLTISGNISGSTTIQLVLGEITEV